MTTGTLTGRAKVHYWLGQFAFGLFWLFASAAVAVVVCSFIWFEQSFYDNSFFWVFFGLAAIFAFMSCRPFAIALAGASTLLIIWDRIRPSFDEQFARGAWHFVVWLALGLTLAFAGFCFGGAIGKGLESKYYDDRPIDPIDD
jgi:hypothetical protein